MLEQRKETNTLNALGVCPTGEHSIDSRQCGFFGCVDLRVWAKARHYRYRLEESYKAEQNAHVKGDGRWFVEIRCRYGLIYPYGGDTVIAHASRMTRHRIAALEGTEHHQYDGNNEAFRFPAELLDEVAAILKPRKRRTVNLTEEQKAALVERLRLAREEHEKSLVQSGQESRERTFLVTEG